MQLSSSIRRQALGQCFLNGLPVILLLWYEQMVETGFFLSTNMCPYHSQILKARNLLLIILTGILGVAAISYVLSLA